MSDRDPVVSTWCGHPRFACPECAFDSLEEANVRSHIDSAHPLPGPKPYPEPEAEQIAEPEETKPARPARKRASKKPTPNPTQEIVPELPADTVTPDDPEENSTDG